MGEFMIVIVLLTASLFSGILIGEVRMGRSIVNQCAEANQIIIDTTVMSCTPTHTIISGKQIPLNQEKK